MVERVGVCVCVRECGLILDCLRVRAVYIGGMCVVYTRTLHTKNTGPHTNTHKRVRARTFMCSRALSSAFNTQEHSLWSKSGSFRHALKDSSVVRVDEHEQIEVEKIEEDTVRVGCMLLLLPRLHHHLICAT